MVEFFEQARQDIYFKTKILRGNRKVLSNGIFEEFFEKNSKDTIEGNFRMNPWDFFLCKGG